MGRCGYHAARMVGVRGGRFFGSDRPTPPRGVLGVSPDRTNELFGRRGVVESAIAAVCGFICPVELRHGSVVTLPVGLVETILGNRFDKTPVTVNPPALPEFRRLFCL
jgi:hypothetical protein